MDFWRLLELIGQQFPQYLPLLSEPGIFDIFKSAIQQTPWFKNTPANDRQWYLLDITDPATARQRKADSGIAVNQIAQQMGVRLSAYDSAIIALNAAVNGWDASRIKMEVVAKSNGGSLGPGGIGDTMHQFQALASQYGVPVNHNDLYWWAANTEGGNVTEAGFRDFVTEQAMNLYPALKGALSQGLTVAQYAAPYFSLAANELGINPTQISPMNPQWMKLLLGSNDKGAQRVLDLNESLRMIRSDPSFGYDRGTPAITQASTFATQLLRQFGAAA
jgi:hypothetical protein